MNTTSQKLSSVTLAVLVVMSMVVGVAGFAGAAAAAERPGQNATITDGESYWQGQILNRDANISGNSSYDLYKVNSDSSDTFMYEVAATNGSISLDSAELSAGEYKLETDSGSVTFEVREQTLDVSVSPENVTTDASSTEFQFDSNRVNFDVIVKSSDFNASELQTMFASATTSTWTDSNNNTHVVLEGVSRGDIYEADISGINSSGSYTFNFEVMDTEESSSATLTAGEAQRGSASFSDTVYSVDAGDVGWFTVNLENTDKANVSLGDSDVGYQYNFTVVDNDGDNKVKVYFDTVKAGNGVQPVFTVDTNDTIENGGADKTLPNSIEQGAYDLSVSVNGEESDIGSLDITSRNSESVSTATVPKSVSKVDAALDAATPSDTVAMGDKLLVSFKVSGVYSFLNNYNAADLAAGSAAADASGISVTVEESEADPNSDPISLDVSKGDLKVDQENDKFYLVLDTREYSQLESNEEYDVSFNMTEAHPYIDSANHDQNLSTSFSVSERDVRMDNYDPAEDTLKYKKTSGDISAQTDIAPGTEVTVVVRHEGANPVLKSVDTKVAKDGSISVPFDFGQFEEGDNFTVELRPLTETFDATLVDARDASLAVSGQSGVKEVSSVAVDAAYMPAAGHLVLQDSEGNVLATKALEEGQHSGIEVALEQPLAETTAVTATLYEDTNSDGKFSPDADAAFKADGDAVSASATIQVKPPAPETYALSVQAVDSEGNTIENASFTLNGQSFSGTAEVENGSYVVEATADGYEAASKTVSVDGSAKTVTLNLTAKEDTSENKTTKTTQQPDETTTSEQPDNNGSDAGTTTTDTKGPGQPGFGVAAALIALAGAALIAHRRN